MILLLVSFNQIGSLRKCSLVLPDDPFANSLFSSFSEAIAILSKVDSFFTYALANYFY